jgi:hypothetical protein
MLNFLLTRQGLERGDEARAAGGDDDAPSTGGYLN